MQTETPQPASPALTRVLQGWSSETQQPSPALTRVLKGWSSCADVEQPSGPAAPLGDWLSAEYDVCLNKTTPSQDPLGDWLLSESPAAVMGERCTSTTSLSEYEPITVQPSRHASVQRSDAGSAKSSSSEVAWLAEPVEPPVSCVSQSTLSRVPAGWLSTEPVAVVAVGVKEEVSKLQRSNNDLMATEDMKQGIAEDFNSVSSHQVDLEEWRLKAGEAEDATLNSSLKSWLLEEEVDSVNVPEEDINKEERIAQMLNDIEMMQKKDVDEMEEESWSAVSEDSIVTLDMTEEDIDADLVVVDPKDTWYSIEQG